MIKFEGFRNYLATAEADQLKFEEGEDIFSKYLPWAIIFGLADRWAKICADLVGDGPVAERDTVLVHRQLSNDSVQHGLPDQQQPHLGGGIGRLIVGCCWHWIRRW